MFGRFDIIGRISQFMIIKVGFPDAGCIW